MSNVFAGIEKTEQDSAKPDNKYITDGAYLVELTKFITRTSTNPKTKGQGLAIAEGTVLEVLDKEENSLRAGQPWVSIYKLERDATPERDLTPKGSKAMGRVKSLIAAAVGVDADMITAAMCGKLAEGDGTSLAGTKLKVVAETITFEEGGKWTKLMWSSLDATAAA